MTTRSSGRNPAERKRAAKPTTSAEISAARNVCPLADSIRAEFSPSLSTRRAPKFELRELGILHLGEFVLNDPADFLDVLHLHQIVDVEGQPKLLLKAAGQSHVTHRIPGSDVVRSGIDRDGLRIHVKRGLKRRLYFSQDIVHMG